MKMMNTIVKRTPIGIMALLMLTIAYASASQHQEDVPINDMPATTMLLGSINADIYDKETKTLNSAIIAIRASNEAQNMLMNIISMHTDRGASYMFLELDPNTVKKLKASISMYQSAISNQLKKGSDVPTPMQQTLATFKLRGYWQARGIWQTTGEAKQITATLLLRYVNADTYAFIISIESPTIDYSPILLYINDNQLEDLKILLSQEKANDARNKAQKSIDALYPSQY